MQDDFEQFADEINEELAKDEALQSIVEFQSKADTFSYDDFDCGKVFGYLVSIKDEYKQDMEERRIIAQAEKVGFKNFKRSLTLYKKKIKRESKPVVIDDGLSDFQQQPFELNTGDWHADDGGIWKYSEGGKGVVIACTHPIMPYQRMRSIDTGLLKYRIAYRRGAVKSKAWSELTIDAGDMLSPTEIVKKLAPYGISISGGDRAKAMVDYLRDMTDLNYEAIPEVKSVSRMGWNEKGFSPYVGGIAFDSAAAFQNIYKSITQSGSFERWLYEAREARTYSPTARIVLASSFAAPLIEPLGVQSFFVHLWSTSSGTGKSVAQMLGASVWANPTIGGAFFPTFRSTSVGFEIIAGFLHNLPLFIDELQLAKDSRGNAKFNVYELSSGAGKLRSNKALGLNYTPKWSTCFITSGETPIVRETDGEGALNRVLEIECFADNQAIADGYRTANAVRDNYGWAGKIFISKLLEGADEADVVQSIKEKCLPIYERFFSACVKNDTTEKQAMAAATILTADELATEYIFQDSRSLSVEEIGEFLKSRERVSLMDRGYDILCDWCVINANKLKGIREEDKNECYGMIDGSRVYIIRTVFDKVCANYEINAHGLLSHMKTHGLIETDGSRMTVNKRLGGSSPAARCVCMHLPVIESHKSDDDDLPLGL